MSIARESPPSTSQCPSSAKWYTLPALAWHFGSAHSLNIHIFDLFTKNVITNLLVLSVAVFIDFGSVVGTYLPRVRDERGWDTWCETRKRIEAINFLRDSNQSKYLPLI